jgi:hypothetical protein
MGQSQFTYLKLDERFVMKCKITVKNMKDVERREV